MRQKFERPKVEDVAGTVRVHSRAADVLADLIHNQQIGVLKRQPRQPSFRQNKELFFSWFKLLRTNRFDSSSFIIGVFHDRQGESDGRPGADRPANRANDLIERMIQENLMVGESPGVLAKANHHHL